MRRNKGAFAAGIIVAVALIAGTSVSIWQARRAIHNERSARAEARKSGQVAELLSDMLHGVGPSVALGRDTTLLREILDKTVDRLVKDLVNQPDVEAPLRNTLGSVYFELGEYPKAEEMHREALAKYQNVLGNDDAAVALSELFLAQALIGQGTVVKTGKRQARGNFAEAESLARQALALNRKRPENVHEVASALGVLGTALGGQDKLVEAEALQREALGMLRKCLGNEHADVAGSLGSLGTVLSNEGKLPEAETMLRDALALLRRLFGNEHPNVAVGLHNLALVLKKEGKVDEAEKLHRDSVAISRKLLGTSHPGVAISLGNLGITLEANGKLVEAEAAWREALAVRRKVFGNEDPDSNIYLVRLTNVLANEGKLEEAEAMLRDALNLLKPPSLNDSSSESSEFGLVLHHLAEVLRKRQKLPEARTLSTEAVAMYERHPAWSQDERNHAGQVLAEVLKQLGTLTEAEHVLDESLRTTTLNQSQNARLLRSRGNLRARMGHWKEAAADFTKVVEFEPTDHENYHSLVPLLVQSADLEGYRRQCAEVLRRFAGTKEAPIADRMAKDCLILSSSGADLQIVSQWTETALTVGKNDGFLPYFQFCKALAEYRQAHYLEALRFTEKVLGKIGHDSNRDVQAYMVAAMAHFQLQQRAEAQTALAAGVEIARTKLPRLESGDLGAAWRDWIIARALLDEATTLIESGSVPATERGEKK